MKKLCLLLMLIPGLSWAGNFGSSIEGKDANVSFTHTSAIDSAHFIFGYPDTTNWYDSVFTYPVAWGSDKILNGAGLDLDSIGVHIVKVRYYSGGAVTGHTAGVWLHEADTVRAYLATHDSTLLEIAAACGSGTGSDTLDIIVFDADTTAVEGVNLCIYNPTKTAKAVPSIKTDVNGYCQVFLDPGSYPTWVRRLGVILAEWDTVTVPSGGGRDTIWVVAQAQGSPPSGDLTQVRGYIRTMTDNQYSKGWIEFAYHDANIMDTSESPAVYIDPTPITTQVDTGAFTVNLKSSLQLLSVVQDGPDKDSVTYDVTIWAPGQTTFRWFNVFIPDSSGAVWLEDLID